MCISTDKNHEILGTKGNGASLMYYPKWLLHNVTHHYVSMFGSANKSDVNLWFEFLVEDMTKSRQWIPAESTCDGMPTTLNYHFLWTYTGHSKHPQPKILSSKVSYGFSSLKFFKRNHTDEQNFYFSTSVSWSYHSGANRGENIPPPTPNLMFSLPSDAFYPFVTSSAQSLAFEDYKILLLPWIGVILFINLI